jgi:uncharacterized membrane protein (DUF106 family)
MKIDEISSEEERIEEDYKYLNPTNFVISGLVLVIIVLFFLYSISSKEREKIEKDPHELEKIYKEIEEKNKKIEECKKIVPESLKAIKEKKEEANKKFPFLYGGNDRGE